MKKYDYRLFLTGIFRVTSFLFPSCVSLAKMKRLNSSAAATETLYPLPFWLSEIKEMPEIEVMPVFYLYNASQRGNFLRGIIYRRGTLKDGSGGTYLLTTTEWYRRIPDGITLASVENTGWILFIQGEENTIETLKYMNFRQQFIIPGEWNQPIPNNMAEFSIKPDEPLAWDTSKLSEKTKETISSRIADA